MPRGGKRQGKPYVSHGQRTDLNERGFTGQTYGVATAQREATSAVPPSGPPQPLKARDVVTAGMPKPGSLGDLLGESERPGEPVTAGAAAGPGPGPEALGLTGRDAVRAADYRALAPYLPVLTFLSQHRATPSGAEFIRHILAGAPPGGS